MPIYKLTNPNTGEEKNTEDRPSPPTAEEAKAYFDKPYTVNASSRSPQMAVGTPEQIREISEQNFIDARGLTENVQLPIPIPKGDRRNILPGTQHEAETVAPIFSRVINSLAPTEEESINHWRKISSNGKYIPLPNGRGLIGRSDGKGGHNMVMTDPVGFDLGDYADLAGMAPEVTTGLIAGLAASPTILSVPAKLLAISGAESIASNVVGGVQDAVFRASQGSEINIPEIFKRRGKAALIETAAGFALPYGLDKYLTRSGSRKGFANLKKAVNDELDRSKNALESRGIRPDRASELGDSVLAKNPTETSIEDAGQAMLRQVNEADVSLRSAATQSIGKSAKEVEEAAFKITGPDISGNVMTRQEAGASVQSSARVVVKEARDAIGDKYNEAYQQIGEASGEAGEFIIDLKSTRAAVAELKKTLMRQPGPDGNMVESALFTEILGTLNKLDSTASATQRLDAVRSTRTMLGELIGGSRQKLDQVGGTNAKRLYEALSNDITNSVSKYTGPGAQALQEADIAYRALIEPIESSKLATQILADARNGGFKDSHEVIDGMLGAGEDQWRGLQTILPPQVYADARRSVADTITRDTTQFAGNQVADLGAMNRRLSNMEPEVKTRIFGSESQWKTLENYGNQFEKLQRAEGLFTRVALPDQDALNDLARSGISTGPGSLDFGKALRSANERRINLGQSLVSQVKNGNILQVSQDPQRFMDSVILSGAQTPQTVGRIMEKLPPETQEQVGQAVFHYIFDNARNATDAAIRETSGSFSSEKMLNLVYGKKSQREVIKKVLGPERYSVMEDYVSYMTALSTRNKLRADRSGGRNIASVLATAPYGNLFAARIASYAMEKASGKAFIAQALPESVELFSRARLLENNPRATAGAIALIQEVSRISGYEEYMDMMSELPPEHRDTLDNYLNGK